jgi:glycosyltransferase involved in cell wall biosynthesis
MKTVIFRGPALTQSGYGQHSRQLIKWLMGRKDVNLKILTTPWGDTPWLIDRNAQNGFVGQIMDRCVSPEQATNSDVSFQLQLPNEWDPNLSRINIGVTAAIETDRCNPAWINACNNMHSVIVPSEHAKLSLTNTGRLTKPIHVVHESYIEEIDNVTHNNVFDKFSTSFNFLVFGQITGNNPYNDRKNTFNTIKWICEKFKNNKEVGIVIKTNAGRNTKIDRNLVTSILKHLINEVRVGEFPRIHLLHGDMNDNEVASLYKHSQIKALVSLTRGEGFGLPTLEAAASGLPIIATGWSGHLEFLKLGKFVNVNYNVQEIHKTRVDNNLFMQGAKWAEPLEQDFKSKIEKFYNSNTTPKQWANELQKKIKVSFCQENICKQYDVIADKVFL